MRQHPRHRQPAPPRRRGLRLRGREEQVRGGHQQPLQTAGRQGDKRQMFYLTSHIVYLLYFEVIEALRGFDCKSDI